MPGEKKNVNEQLPLVAQMTWNNLCITCHISFF